MMLGLGSTRCCTQGDISDPTMISIVGSGGQFLVRQLDGTGMITPDMCDLQCTVGLPGPGTGAYGTTGSTGSMGTLALAIALGFGLFLLR